MPPGVHDGLNRTSTHSPSLIIDIQSMQNRIGLCRQLYNNHRLPNTRTDTGEHKIAPIVLAISLPYTRTTLKSNEKPNLPRAFVVVFGRNHQQSVLVWSWFVKSRTEAGGPDCESLPPADKPGQ